MEDSEGQGDFSSEVQKAHLEQSFRKAEHKTTVTNTFLRFIK